MKYGGAARGRRPEQHQREVRGVIARPECRETPIGVTNLNPDRLIMLWYYVVIVLSAVLLLAACTPY
jgi:hypothetical protein